MLKWVLIFALIAVVASLLGFGGVAAGAAGISKFLLLLMVLGFVLVVGLGVLAMKRLRR